MTAGGPRSAVGVMCRLYPQTSLRNMYEDIPEVSSSNRKLAGHGLQGDQMAISSKRTSGQGRHSAAYRRILGVQSAIPSRHSISRSRAKPKDEHSFSES